MGTLVNLTMAEARPVDTLGTAVFEGVPPSLGASAVTSLVALGCLAKQDPSQPSMLPCRVHSFFRGLPGLWVCMDSRCAEVSVEERNGPTGKLFGQPRDVCDCGARVLELYTCRNCGTAYARAYTTDVLEPEFLWPEAGSVLRTEDREYDELAPIDLLLEEPVFVDNVEPAEYDIVTGRLNPQQPGQRNRRVYIRADRSTPVKPESNLDTTKRGEFRPCAVCGESAGFGRSSVQDHQTKGDQPFQAFDRQADRSAAS